VCTELGAEILKLPVTQSRLRKLRESIRRALSERDAFEHVHRRR